VAGKLKVPPGPDKLYWTLLPTDPVRKPLIVIPIPESVKEPSALKVPVKVTGGIEVNTVPPNENGDDATLALEVAVNTKLCGDVGKAEAIGTVTVVGTVIVVYPGGAGKVCWV